MKAIVHIGSAKTGTTTLQSFFRDNRQALLDQGLWYPRAAGDRNHTRMALAAAWPETSLHHHKMGLADPARYEAHHTQFVKEFEAELASHRGHACLLSSEHFFGIFSGERLPRLRDFLARYFDDVRFICYVRNPVDFALSIHSTRVKTGGAEPFDPAAATGPGRGELLESWVDMFGPERVTTRLYDRARLVNGNIVDDFCPLAGIDLSRLTPPEKAENTSLDLVRLEVLREINERHATFFRGLKGARRQDLVSRFERISRAGALAISPAAAAIIRDMRADDTRLLAGISGIPFDALDLSRGTRAEPPHLDDFTLDHDHILETLLLLWADMEAEIHRLKQAARQQPSSPDTGTGT